MLNSQLADATCSLEQRPCRNWQDVLLGPAAQLTCYQQMLPRAELQAQVCHCRAASGRHHAELLKAQQRGLGGAAGGTERPSRRVSNRCKGFCKHRWRCVGTQGDWVGAAACKPAVREKESRHEGE